MARPSPQLYEQAQRVICYLARHRNIGLRYEADGSRLHGMSDSDWAVKHSASGYVSNYCRAAISWGCKKQATVALFSCEAEIVAASEATKEAVYLDRFITELGDPSYGPVPLSVDNQAAHDMAHTPEHHARI
eukprot:CAMPEP_0183349728 /NCGR_PEP_ID=MMETSP0164_2-20130417/13821_1 /TAXON_ID=221442 /ORGANISM="Coccolithus pelagicus ssp braarudi, Strain PLY182g" /LENGTH=131 /DNA_ID=CAMNT_0025521499 /DNA_START=198 /DNA_END=593 /DNA_ORIENTATION=-